MYLVSKSVERTYIVSAALSTMCETKGVRNKPLKPGHFNLAGKRTFQNGLDSNVSVIILSETRCYVKCQMKPR
jgi:hypothetical protein